MARMLVVVNPNAKHGATRELVPVMAELLAACDADIVSTEAPAQAAELAEKADGYETVVAAGGDGTVHEVLNGLMRRPADDRPALGILPAGSGNDYAATVGVPKDLAAAARLLATGTVRRFDVGVANGVYFANSIAMGFDAKVTAKAVELKRATGRSGLPLYLSAMLDVMLHDFTSHRVRLSFDGGPDEDRELTLIAVTIGPTYGGGFRIVPMAVPDDGLLDVLVIDPLPMRGALWRFPFVVVGRHGWMRQVHFSRHTRVRVSSDVPLPGQIDGEVTLSASYDISILPAAVEVVVPRSG